MKIFIVLAALAVCALAKPFGGEQSVSVTQDTLGRYQVNVETLDLSRNEESDGNGNVRGEYQYIDANGAVQTVHYTAGVDGFHATGSNIPVAPIDLNTPVQDTPEVAEAKALHFAKLAEFGH